MRSKFSFCIYFLILCSAEAFTRSSVRTPSLFVSNRHSTRLFEQLEERSKGPFDFILNPYDSKIPKEIEKEIYEAEANTPAAKDRSKRVALYALLAFVGILFAFFNGFVTELRTTDTPDGTAFDLEQAGFGWVQSNFFFKFLFMNKIGGGLALLLGAGSGLLAEAEYDTRRINAEEIFEELQRRKDEKTKKKKVSPKKKKKKRRSGKETKRLEALSEVVAEDKETVVEVKKETTDEVEEKAPVAEPEKKEDQEAGIFGGLKNFYDKADKMAASQALLLNKKLEDEGILEKITDESGLKVVGREQAKKQQKGNQATDDTNESKSKTD